MTYPETHLVHHSHTVLEDGRHLAYAVWGDPEGTPYLEFRGLPSSDLGDLVPPGLLIGLHLRRITVDRPGIGRSDPMPGRRLVDWPADVLQLVDHLGLSSFAVLGTSGGGPYALACAALLPAGRVTRVTLVSGLGPMDRPGAARGMNHGQRWAMVVARRTPVLARALAGLALSREHHRPGSLAHGIVPTLAHCERDVAGHLAVQASLTDSYERAFAHGVAGQVLDWAIVGGPWGFDPATITVPVHLWQGSEDNRVPLHHAQHLAERIPRAWLTVLPGEGHMIAFTRIGAILTELASPATTSPPA